MRLFNNLTKRGFAMILAIVMIVGLLPVASMASELSAEAEQAEIVVNVPASEEISSDTDKTAPDEGEPSNEAPAPAPEDLLQAAFAAAQAVEAAALVTEEDAEAMAGDTYYSTLKEAVNKAAAGDTVVLCKDAQVASSNGLSISKDITLDLGGYTLTGSGTALNVGKGDIVIQNGTITAPTAINYDGTKLTLLGVTLQAESCGIAYYGGEELTVDDDCTINAASGTGILIDPLPRTAPKTLVSGKVTAVTPVEITAWASGEPAVEIKAPAVLTASGEDGTAIRQGIGSLTITGGTVAGLVSVTEDTAVTITGGRFTDTGTVAALLSSDYVLDETGSVVSAATLDNVAARVGAALYPTLQDAINAGNGQTVVLLKDVEENVTVPAGSVVTLDLNGMTLNGGTVSGEAALTNYGTVTIADSSEKQTGTIRRADDNTSGYYTVKNAGKMYITGGNITNNANSSSLVINYNNQGEDGFGAFEGVEMEISGGVLTQGKYVALKTDPNTKLTIKDGATVISGSTTNFYGTVIMEGGDVQMNGIVLVLSHGQSNADYDAVFEVKGGTLKCDSVQIGNGYSGTVTEYGPSFIVSGTADVTAGSIFAKVAGNLVTDNNGAHVEVRGGTLKTADGENWTVAKAGNTAYLTMEAAIAAAGEQDAVQLLKDVRLERGIAVDKAVVLDLNGKTVTGDVTPFAVGPEGQLSVTGSGKVISGSPLFSVEEGGGVALLGGSYSADVSDYAAAGFMVVENELYDVVKLDQSNAAAAVTAGGATAYYANLRAAVDAANQAASATVTLYRDVQESITVTGDVTLALNGKTLTNTPEIDTVTVALGGSLTVTGSGTVDNISHGRAALFNNGTADLNGGTYDRSAEQGASASDNGGNSFYTVVNHGAMTISGATVRQTGSYSSLVENGYQSFSGSNSRQSHVPGVNAEQPTLRIVNGVFSGGLNNVKNDDNGVLTIVSGLFENAAQNAVLNWNHAVVADGIFYMPVANGHGEAGGVNALDLSVTGGAFSNDVTAYCPMGQAAALESGVYRIADVQLSVNETATVSVGGTVQLDAAVNPATVGAVWTSGDETIATVENGLVTAHAKGTVTITLSARGKTAACRVTVTQPVTGVTLDRTAVTLKAEETVTLTAAVTPGDADELGVTWTSDNEAVATVADGVVTAVAPGRAVITVTTVDGAYTASCTVTVASDAPVGPVGPVGPTTDITEPDVPLAGVLPFDDVAETDWFHEAVRYVYENDLMQGTADNAFSPYADTTRGMIVTILYRLEGSPAVSGPSEFSDVTAGTWYHDAVVWGAAHEIVAGYGDGTYGPADRITREQFAAILYRYAQFKGYDLTVPDGAALDFSDGEAVSDYAEAAVLWAVEKELLHGMGDGTLSARTGATRAQAAVILHAFCTGVAK